MSNKITCLDFFNNFNNGDLHVVRTLIKYVMKTFPGFNYRLRHPNDVKVLKDLHIPLYWKTPPAKFDYRGYYQEYGILNFNTQALCHDRQFFDKNSFTIVTFYNIFAKTLLDVFKFKMPERILDFLPQVDYNVYDIKNLKKLDMSGKNVLVCNNIPLSEQSTTFDMNDLLKQIVTLYPNIHFFVTNKATLESPNISYVSDITGDIGNDLNEISYLSTRCDCIIGRYSGPHTFTYVRENLLNPKKMFVTFSPPSSLYGMTPEKWSDFGIQSLTTPDEHAQFFNIPENDDGIRVSKLWTILEKLSES